MNESFHCDDNDGEFMVWNAVNSFCRLPHYGVNEVNEGLINGLNELLGCSLVGCSSGSKAGDGAARDPSVPPPAACISWVQGRRHATLTLDNTPDVMTTKQHIPP